MTDLEAMLRAGAEVRDVARKRALVLDGARDALGDFNRFRPGREIPLLRVASLLRHRLERAHTTVLLEAHAILVEVLARGLVRPREHRPHHHRRRTERERLDDVPRRRDAA